MAIDLDADRWDTVRKGGAQRRTTPKLTIYGNGNGYLNACADEKLGADSVVYKADATTNELVILDEELDPDTDSGGGYAVSREEDTPGGDINLVKVLGRKFGVDPENIDETHYFALDIEDGYAVADISELPGVESTEEWPDDGPGPKAVQDAADSADSVQELSDVLDVPTDTARGLAMDVGAYTDLQDAEAGYGKRGEV